MGKAEGRRQKKAKDPQAPKRATTAYMLWANTNRDQIKAQFPTMNLPQLSQEMGKLWKEMTVIEKQPWAEAAMRDKERYDREQQMYVQSGAQASFQRKHADEPGTKKKRGKKDPNAPKRWSPAYMFFAKDKRPEVVAQNPEAKFGEVGRIIGQLWQNAPEAVKAHYEALSAQDKERYEREMRAFRETGTFDNSADESEESD